MSFNSLIANFVICKYAMPFESMVWYLLVWYLKSHSFNSNRSPEMTIFNKQLGFVLIRFSNLMIARRKLLDQKSFWTKHSWEWLSMRDFRIELKRCTLRTFCRKVRSICLWFSTSSGTGVWEWSERWEMQVRRLRTL